MWFNTPPVTSPADLSQSEGDALLVRHLHRVTRDPADLGDLAPFSLPERDGEEYRRLLQVSCRLEELLYEKGQLENLDYSDEDIESLRKQLIQLGPDSEPQNGSQKRKASASESPGIRSKGCKRLRSDAVMEEIPACLKHHYKAPKVKAAVLEELEGVIQFRVVNNDNSPMNMIILTGLKNIFQKQLPKMPREYIARLIYDRNHLSMAIVRGTDTGKIEVMGGITYRPFNHRRFAEIVFCAIASNEQVRGYGAHLMNHLKDYVKASSPIIHFLTYADNYAIGYFKKQGFTKDISLDRQIWVGYIKDYEGGTIMQCTMLPEIRYLDSAEILARQKAAILYKIAATSQDAKVYPGLAAFKNGSVMDPEQIPGLCETGWSKESDALARQPRRPGHYHVLQTLLSELQNHPSAWPFVQAVNRDEVPDYYEVIKEPMDLTTMEFKLDNDQYESVAQFIYDAKLVFNNCRAYNNETTTYYKNASRLEKSLTELVQSKFVEYSGLL